MGTIASTRYTIYDFQPPASLPVDIFHEFGYFFVSHIAIHLAAPLQPLSFLHRCHRGLSTGTCLQETNWPFQYSNFHGHGAAVFI